MSLDANNCPPAIHVENEFLLPPTCHPHPMDPSIVCESNFCPLATRDTKQNLAQALGKLDLRYSDCGLWQTANSQSSDTFACSVSRVLPQGFMSCQFRLLVAVEWNIVHQLPICNIDMVNFSVYWPLTVPLTKATSSHFGFLLTEGVQYSRIETLSTSHPSSNRTPYRWRSCSAELITTDSTKTTFSPSPNWLIASNQSFLS